MTRTLTTIALVALALLSCNRQGSKEEPETLANLKTSIELELLANAKYNHYAVEARQDSLPEIAALFHAAAVSEKAHVDRQITMLLAHGKNLGNYIPEFPPYDLRENLKTAIEVEHFEAMDQYPRFVAASDKDKMPDVSESFTWALKAEAKHYELFKQALASLDDPTVVLAKSYMVCPRCGNTMDAEHYSDPCDICENEASKFVEVK